MADHGATAAIDGLREGPVGPLFLLDTRMSDSGVFLQLEQSAEAEVRTVIGVVTEAGAAETEREVVSDGKSTSLLLRNGAGASVTRMEGARGSRDVDSVRVRAPVGLLGCLGFAIRFFFLARGS